MKSKTFSKSFISEISKSYPGITEKRLLEDFEVFKFSKQFSNSNTTSTSILNKFRNKLLDGEPLEYIVKESFFFNSRFYVDDRVLIPRSESELLVERVLEIINEKEIESICEIGIGSMCLGLSVLLEVNQSLQYFGSDISDEALSVARINLTRFKQRLQNHQISLNKHDKFKGINRKFDLIFSNPPYILRSQKFLVHEQVHKFEPHLALYLEDSDHDQWFGNFFEKAKDRLNPKGIILIEGHENNLLRLETIALEYFSQSRIIEDYSHRHRFLELSK